MTQELVTLEGFKKQLCEYFTFSDRTENKYIIIGCIIGSAGLKNCQNKKFIIDFLHVTLHYIYIYIVGNTSFRRLKLSCNYSLMSHSSY